jgi:hypothetical protein
MDQQKKQTSALVMMKIWGVRENAKWRILIARSWRYSNCWVMSGGITGVCNPMEFAQRTLLARIVSSLMTLQANRQDMGKRKRKAGWRTWYVMETEKRKQETNPEIWLCSMQNVLNRENALHLNGFLSGEKHVRVAFLENHKKRVSANGSKEIADKR